MIRTVRRYIGALTTLALSATVAPAAPAAPDVPAALAAPDVVVSIAPVHSLVAAVMEGVGEPRLLVPPGASPHAFSLRPSDAQALANTHLVFRVGPDLETFLDKPLAALASGTVVSLADAPGITEQRIPDQHDGPGDHGDHGDHASDPHIWLSVANARRIAEIAAETLSRHDGENAAAYGRNLAALNDRLDGLQGELRDLLAPVRKSPYIVLHDAYRHFEAAFDLAPATAIALSPERRPGARRLREIRDLLAAQDIKCVFAEPQFPNAIAATVVSGTNATLAELDPIGADLAIGPELYFDLMKNLGRSLAGCLGN
ncbi:MAG: zinc ABC transporter solute-binding protein [Alphaproteobacteria bacterium]|nr:zinc ABC transporter solute-binding protein [Alphaproteobacteria bacterium]